MTNKKWLCEFDALVQTVMGETAPHAICLAALKAIENES